MLYKYRNWPKKSEESFTADIIKNNQFWFAHPSSFNDPYDCQIRVNRADVNEILAIDYLAETFSNNKNEKSQFYRMAYSKLDSFKGDLEKICEFLRERITEFENFFNNKGVLSLSKEPASMLMWGHYGDNHRGIAIGIEPDENGILSDSRFTNPVHYENDYPNISARDVVLAGSWEEWDALSNLIIHTKSSEWSYEKEVRVVIENGGVLFKSPGKISEIIFGARCKSSVIEEVMTLCSHLNLRFKRAFLHSTSFKISFIEM